MSRFVGGDPNGSEGTVLIDLRAEPQNFFTGIVVIAQLATDLLNRNVAEPRRVEYMAGGRRTTECGWLLRCLSIGRVDAKLGPKAQRQWR